MTLVEQIDRDIIEALKSKDAEKLSVLRMLKSSLKNAEIEIKGELSDENVVKILQKEVKQRKDAAESYLQAEREELAEKEISEIKYLEIYLPKQMSDNELDEIISQVIVSSGASGMADIGKVMSAVMPKVAGRADGGTISVKVKELLGK